MNWQNYILKLFYFRLELKMKCLALFLVVCLTSDVVSGQRNFVSSSRSSFSPSSSSSSSFSRQTNFVRPSSATSSFSRPSTSGFSQQSQRSGGSPPAGQSAENLCNLKNFAEDRWSDEIKHFFLNFLGYLYSFYSM